MTAETLVRLYNVGLFHRTIIRSPGHRIVQVEIDGETQLMKLSELESILTDNRDRVRIVMANQKPSWGNCVVQPYAHAS